jgi:hypothetical protein
VCAIAAAVPGCRRSGNWNEVFHRSEGWWYSDGGISAQLPDGKTVWLFGDTRLHDADSVSNSMAVQDSELGRAPLGHEVRFFARAGSGELLDVSKVGRGVARSWAEPPVVSDPSLSSWLWPGGAVVSGGRLIATYGEVGCPVAELPACRGYLGSMKVVGSAVVEVENPTDAAQNWRIRTTPLHDRNGRSPAKNQLIWGNALLEDRGWVYVFGVPFGPDSDVKLARAVPKDVGRYDGWQFLTAKGWQLLPTGPSAVELESVARSAATDLGVSRVVRNGQAWLLMLNLDLLAQEVVVRSTPARELESVRWEGPEAGPRVRRFALPALDPDTAGQVSWAVRAHPQHSSDRSLLVSFFSGRLSSLRFLELPMAAVLD